jgi:16S rRNA (guanine966-N2)-methyltransferase
VRESVFSSITSLLGAELGSGRVLDAFAGSGALGIEALSRGCAHATFVENDRKALQTVQDNLRTLDASGRAQVVLGDVMVLADRAAVPGGPFSLLLLDPPYRLASSDIEGLTSALARGGQLEDGAIIVYEYARDNMVDWPSGFDLATRKKYGSTGVDIVIYEKGEGSS